MSDAARADARAPTLLGWIRHAPLRVFAQAALLFTITVFAVTLPRSVGGEWRPFLTNLGQVTWPLVLLALVTWHLRSISPRALLRWFLAGWFLVTIPVQLVGQASRARFGVFSDMHNAVIVPLSEELSKLAVLLLWLWIATRRGRSVGAVDVAVVGAVIGGGLMLHEEAVWGRALGSWSAPLGLVAPFVWRFDDFPWWEGTVYLVHHIGWSLVAALSIGLAWRLRHRRWAILLAISGVGLALLDHASYNLALNHSADNLARRLVLDGALMLVVIALGLTAAIALDLRSRRIASAALSPAPAPSAWGAARLWRQGEHGWVTRVFLAGWYPRAWNAAAFRLTDARSRAADANERDGGSDATRSTGSQAARETPGSRTGERLMALANACGLRAAPSHGSSERSRASHDR